LGAEHGRGHLYRALIEGIALDVAMGLAHIEGATGEVIRDVVAIGGGARSRLWRQIVADATGRAVLVSETVEATCLGAGMLAAVGAGWYADGATAARAMQGDLAERTVPDEVRHARYARLLPIYQDLHPAMARTFARLAAFREETY
jgi:xylulokinase